MNATKLIAAIAVLAATATVTAFAGEITPIPELDNFHSSRTRAEVRADVATAYSQGWRSGSNYRYSGATSGSSAQSRDASGAEHNLAARHPRQDIYFGD
jgi:hypothetical protein